MSEITMMSVLNRARQREVPSRYGRCLTYPLYTSYNEVYDYNNLKNSILSWREYSVVEEDCVDKMLELFNIVNEHGDISEIEECNSIIESNISQLKDFTDVESVLRLTKNTDTVMDTIADLKKCDMMIKTHNDICKRFDIDSYVQEKAYPENMYDCIYELCSFIDTYKMGINTKYKTCLNECQYAFAKNHIQYTDSMIIEGVTDYFLYNHLNEEDLDGELIDIMKDVISVNPFIHETTYLDRLKEYYVETVKEEKLDNIFEAVNTKAIVNKTIEKFKTMPSKSIAAFKSTVNTIVHTMANTDREEDVIVESKNLLALSFHFFIIVGATAVSPWIGIAAFIASTLTRIHLTRKSTKKALSVWYKNRAKAAKQLEDCKDEEKKKRLKEYIKGLDDGIEKLESHYDRMKDDEEKDAYDLRPDDYDGKKGGDFGDMDMNFESAQNLGNVDYTYALTNSMANAIIESLNSFDQYEAYKTLMYPSLFKNLDHAKYMTEFAYNYPAMIEPRAVKRQITEAVRMERKEEHPDYEVISKLNEYKALLNLPKVFEVNDNPNNIINSVSEASVDIDHMVNYIHEMSIGNTVSIALDKVKSTLGKLDVRQQMISNQIDANARTVEKNFNKIARYGNREAVVKGDWLPPLSKCIKLVLGLGGLAFINPFLGLVAAVAVGLARNKNLRQERQKFINELDVELVMVDKYIKQAEEKNDLERVRQLLLVKKKLQGHYAKMKWRMKVDYNDKDINDARGLPGGEED